VKAEVSVNEKGMFLRVARSTMWKIVVSRRSRRSAIEECGQRSGIDCEEKERCVVKWGGTR
jgi:hypothetical protein